MEEFDASPSAASLIEGLRDFGYTFNTSSADIIDNSIAANATKIEVRATFGDGDPKIAFIDNGDGMTAEDLRTAMKPGSHSPKDKRALHDLGRFGLGLKTASFGQCRRLTVITRFKGVTNAARWDLDHVAKTNKWSVLIPDPSIESIFGIEDLPQDHGTLVLWEEIDRMGVDGNDSASENHFTERLFSLGQHLGLVFHRFLDGDAKQHKRITMNLNGSRIESRNPFNFRNQKTNRKPQETLSNRALVNAYILPHPKSVDQSEWLAYEGDEGYVNSQGFYLYRVDRLIVWATWFGIVRKSAATKLLRVAIDIDNSNDEVWQINVLKASANLPRATRAELRNLIGNWQSGAKATYQKRERTIDTDHGLRTWMRNETDEAIVYDINFESTYVKAVLDDILPESREKVRKLLKIVASDLPLDLLFVDLSDHQERLDVGRLGKDLAIEIGSNLARTFMKDGAAVTEAIERLSFMGMFATYVDEIKSVVLKDEI